MKYVLEIILTTIIIFFVWNMMKRIFYTSFYKFPKQENPKSTSEFQQKKTTDKKKTGLNWDAEDADFEEVKDEEKINR